MGYYRSWGRDEGHFEEMVWASLAEDGQKILSWKLKAPYDTFLWILGDETRDGAVVCSLDVGGKQAPGNLPEPFVIGDAFATLSLLITGFIGTHAVTLVEFEIAFCHESLLYSIIPYWLFPMGKGIRPHFLMDKETPRTEIQRASFAVLFVIPEIFVKGQLSSRG